MYIFQNLHTVPIKRNNYTYTVYIRTEVFSFSFVYCVGVLMSEQMNKSLLDTASEHSNNMKRTSVQFIRILRNTTEKMLHA